MAVPPKSSVYVAALRLGARALLLHQLSASQYPAGLVESQDPAVCGLCFVGFDLVSCTTYGKYHFVVLLSPQHVHYK